MARCWILADTDSFYLKSRTDSQTTVSEFPAHAWESPTYIPHESRPLNVSPDLSYLSMANTDLLLAATSNHALANTDTFSDTASDSGGPRSILKKRGCKSATLPRSHSSPSIRDSLEVTKQHMQGVRAESSQVCVVNP